MANSRCIVLVPVAHHIEPHCELALRQLESAGYAVNRWYGASAIDMIRNRLASEALAAGFEELMWIDADIAFEPASVDRLRAHGLPLVGGLYPTKVECRPTWIAAADQNVVLGPDGGLVGLSYMPTGFLYTRSEVYHEMKRHEGLPVCNRKLGQPMVPYFLPMIVSDGLESWYLTEDYAFCERARRCGYRLVADTTIRLQHIGAYGYSLWPK